MTFFLEAGFDPLGVLYGIRGYVGTFFGCTYCAQHFMEMVTKNLKMEDWVSRLDFGVYLRLRIFLFSGQILLGRGHVFVAGP